MNDNENFNEWHEDDMSFHKNTMVSFSQCTPDRKMAWTEIFRFTSDNAGEDFTKRGMSWEFLIKEKGIAFVVSRTSFHVHKMPVADQRITFNSFETAPEGPLSGRYYEFVDTQSNEKLITAHTVWSILDMKQRKMLPAKSFDLRPTPTTSADVFTGIKTGRIKLPENAELFGSRKIVYSDLDANGHTNNARYIAFVFDVLPEEYQKMEYKDVRLNYSKEALFGENLVIKGCIDAEQKKITVAGLIEEQSSFECELYW